MLIVLLAAWLATAIASNEKNNFFGRPQNHKPYHSSSSASCSGCSEKEDSVFEPEHVLIRKGDYQLERAYEFYTAGPGQFSAQSFQISVTNTLWVAITDCYCSGDSYLLWDNGFPMEFGQCEAIPDDICTVYSTDFFQCAVEETPYCHGQALIYSGFHNITIQSLIAPYLTAGGFIYFYEAGGK